MGVLISFVQAANLLASFIVPAQQLASFFSSVKNLDPSVAVNISNLDGSALTADEETIKIIADWKTQHGLA